MVAGLAVFIPEALVQKRIPYLAYTQGFHALAGQTDTAAGYSGGIGRRRNRSRINPLSGVADSFRIG
ncbi:hypothetical protein SDC9_153298 [bioreactor metagenome]|uniref:Uncharacterized protein n=1 Tax=bioreactor metagenome TaxID=1076179 RepID=A0A645F079_9ZZZZ